MAGNQPVRCNRERGRSCPFADNDMCRAHALLVSKAGRFVSVIRDLDPQAQASLMDAALQVERNSLPGCRPFQVTRPDGRVELGYATAQWVIELYRWLVTESRIPELQRRRMLAVLLGFGAESIGTMETVWQLMWSM